MTEPGLRTGHGTTNNTQVYYRKIGAFRFPEAQAGRMNCYMNLTATQVKGLASTNLIGPAISSSFSSWQRKSLKPMIMAE